MGWTFPALVPVTCWPCPSGHLMGGDSELSRIWNLLRKNRKKVLVAQSCPIHCHPWTGAHQTPLSMEFSRQEYWVGCHALLQGIFLTQGSNLGYLSYRQILYHLSHQGSFLFLTWFQTFPFNFPWYYWLYSVGLELFSFLETKWVLFTLLLGGKRKNFSHK